MKRDLTHGSCRRSCPRWPPSILDLDFYFTEGVERYTNLFGLQGHLLSEQQQLLLGTLGEGEAERDFELLQHEKSKVMERRLLNLPQGPFCRLGILR